MDDFTIGYLIGLIVGEGSFSHHGKNPVLCMGLHASDPFPIETLQRYLGGRIYGPYAHLSKEDGRVRRTIKWHLTGNDLREKVSFFDTYLPPSRTRTQFDNWKREYSEYLSKPIRRVRVQKT